MSYLLYICLPKPLPLTRDLSNREIIAKTSTTVKKGKKQSKIDEYRIFMADSGDSQNSQNSDDLNSHVPKVAGKVIGKGGKATGKAIKVASNIGKEGKGLAVKGKGGGGGGAKDKDRNSVKPIRG